MMENQPSQPENRFVTVIIPVLNESNTVASVVEFAWRDSRVNEVIVIDDGSIDGTPELASAAGATVITSTMLGKGGSMEDGMRMAKNETLLYLDGDLTGLAADLIQKMTDPILSGSADFAKARFTRSAGRVTCLTARPLLRTYFPEIVSFEQPLGGIISVRRSLVQNFRFENDYGVDIGLLIDAAMNKARLIEVDIGHIDHDSQPLHVLEEMATQVARTVFDRASAYGRFRYSFIRQVQETERHQRVNLSSILQRIPKCEQLALFDMDGVLLNGRFIVELARRTEKTAALSEFLDRFDMNPQERARRIASIFAGIPKEVFYQVAREIPLMPGAIDTVVRLRKAGFRVGIVTDSFYAAAETVRRRVFADFCFSNLMRFKNEKASGRVTLAPGMVHPRGCKVHKHCKVNVMLHLIEKMEITPERVLAVGDGENDICMLQAAGLSIAFEPKTENVRAAAQHVFDKDLTRVLSVVEK